MNIVVIGGGAAGFFGAIACAESNPQASVILLEKTKQLLSKVRISGGGRCNVTHSCFDPKVLVQYYPRGGKALLGPFHRFQPRDTIEWFSQRGVTLKTEEDGRMFPVTDSSETIIACLMSEAEKAGVVIRTQTSVQGIEKNDEGFILTLGNGETLIAQRILVATGSNPAVHEWLTSLGHMIVPPVPSLFTFNIPHSPLLDLAGVSVDQVRVKIADTSLEQTGPLLITHWGFSGPAVLKLSAWGARVLHERGYKATVLVDWLPDASRESTMQALKQMKMQNPQKLAHTECPFSLPRNLWKRLVQLAGIEETQRWAALSHQTLANLTERLHASTFLLEGKTTYKQEFVTCGGVDLDEVNFKTMESRKCPGLFFAGEVLDIDGVTGGFNFQNAWTTSWIAGLAMNS